MKILKKHTPDKLFYAKVWHTNSHIFISKAEWNTLVYPWLSCFNYSQMGLKEDQNKLYFDGVNQWWRKDFFHQNRRQ